jgi:hypothetical protein
MGGRSLGLVGCTEKNGEGKRWAGCKRIGPTGRVLKIAFPISKLIFYFANCIEFKTRLKFDRF